MMSKLQGKTFTIILLLSLAVNLFFAGFIVSRIMSHDRHSGCKIGHSSPATITRVYPEDEKRAFRKAMREERRYFRDLRSLNKQQRFNFLNVLAKEDLTREDLQLALSKIEAGQQVIKQKVENILIDQLLEMDFATRQKIVEDAKNYRHDHHRKNKCDKDKHRKSGHDHQPPKEP